MNSTFVNRELRATIRPSLQANGFTAFTARSAWRYHPGRIDIINFQSFNDYLASSVGCTTFSFSLNLSVYLIGLPQDGLPIKERQGQLQPEEWRGHLRLHPERTIEQAELSRRDIWYIDPKGDYLAAAVRDARNVLLEVGLAWFERWGTDAAVLEALRHPEATLGDGTELPGTPDSPARNQVVGYVAYRAGQSATARQYLERALAQYEAIDSRNAQMKLRRPLPPVTPEGLRYLVAQLKSTA
jgi:hypothetical protein